jgi:hypothetical protein
MATVHVRAETAVFDLGWYDEMITERTPLIEAAIAEGRLTVLEDEGPPRGAELDQRLRDLGLSTSGTVAEKQERLAEAEGTGSGGTGPGGSVPERPAPDSAEAVEEKVPETSPDTPARTAANRRE